MNNVGTSYLFWCFWFFGAAGVHRLYNRKIASGILWLCTYGLFGIGQIIDLFLISDMVEDYNLKERARLGYSPTGIPLNQATVQLVIPPEAIQASLLAAQTKTEALPTPVTREQLMVKLLKAAEMRGGRLSVTQGVVDTGCDFKEVESVLREMVKSGYVAIENHPTTGVVLYNFLEL